MPVVADDAAAAREVPAPRASSTYPILKWSVVISLAAICLYFALRGVEWKHVASIVAQCRLQFLTFALVCSAMAYVVRAMRWRLLLTAQENIAPATVLWASSAGYLANNYLPARAGELVRTAMISSRSRLSKTYVFTTAMTERVIELVILVFMASLMSLTLAQTPAWLARLMLLIVIGAIAGIALLLVLPKLDRASTGIIARLPVSQGVKHRLHGIAQSATLALTALRDPSRLFQVCAVTALVWTLDATAAVILAHALGMRLLFAVALLLLTGLALGNALPSTPGAVGIFQFAAVTVLAPFNFTHTDAIAFILVAQAASYVVITTLGLVGLWRYRLARKNRSFNDAKE